MGNMRTARLRFMGSEIIGGSHTAPSFRNRFPERGPMYNKDPDPKNGLADKGGSGPEEKRSTGGYTAQTGKPPATEGSEKPEKREPITDEEKIRRLRGVLGSIEAAKGAKEGATADNAQPRQERPPEPAANHVVQAQIGGLLSRVQSLEQKPVAIDYSGSIAALQKSTAALEAIWREMPRDLQQILAGIQKELGSSARVVNRKADETKLTAVETRLGALETAAKEIHKGLQQKLDELTGAVNGLDPQKLIQFREDMVLFEGRVTDTVLAKMKTELEKMETVSRAEKTATDEEIKLLRDRIAALERRLIPLETAKVEIPGNLQQTLGELRKDLADLTQIVNGKIDLETIVDLRRDITLLEGRIDDIVDLDDGEIKKIRDEIATLGTTIGDINREGTLVERLERENAGLKQEIAEQTAVRAAATAPSAAQTSDDGVVVLPLPPQRTASKRSDQHSEVVVLPPPSK